jgi:hypothetical protein
MPPGSETTCDQSGDLIGSEFSDSCSEGAVALSADGARWDGAAFNHHTQGSMSALEIIRDAVLRLSIGFRSKYSVGLARHWQ